jgi:catechol 2,3-dioxygenase-like lactoylglutathione lyase family enzyme
MDTLPRFLEISVPSADVRASLEWYRALGFAELMTGDIRDYPYAVISDGDLYLGLHATGLEQAGLSFVRPDLARFVLDASDRGVEFDAARLGIEDFHEAVRRDPVGNPGILIEARTFSSTQVTEASLVGRLSHVALPCLDVGASLGFWEQFGFIGVESDTGEPAELHAPGLRLQLRAGTRELTLYFQNADIEPALEGLTRVGIEARMTVEGQELRAPEGTRIIVKGSE